MKTPSFVRVRGSVKISLMRSCVVSRATDCREASSVMAVAGRGLGSNAARVPRSNASGIAFCG
jgi:hypothetical protein